MSKKLFLRNLDSYDITADDFWSTSLLSGVLMESFARKVGLDGENAYLIGIMHAAGRIIIDQVVIQNHPGTKWDGNGDLPAWERRNAGLDSAEACAILLRQWRFPDWLCDVIEKQNCEELPDGQKSLMGLLHFIRRTLPLKHLHGPIATPSFNDPFLRQCGVGLEDAHSLVAQGIERLLAVESSVLR